MTDELDRLIDETMQREPRIVTIATVGYDEDGDPIRRVVAIRPAFDPLTAGWVLCACRCHQTEWISTGHVHDRCPHCDGLGIVIGPPTDGKHLATFLDARTYYHPDLRPIFTQEYWRNRDD